VTSFWSKLLACLDRDGAVALVSVQRASGSTPREAGARMAVTRNGEIIETIGGGALEFAVLNAAVKAMAEGQRGSLLRDWPLGPDLGQCCGGRVTTVTDLYAMADRERLVERALADEGADRSRLLLFGAGHVGRALVLALAPLPFDILWIDSRAEIFPSVVAQSATVVVSASPEHEIARARPGDFILVMTHSHALDLSIVEAALRRPDLAYVGLIGSDTKRARFSSRLQAMGAEAKAIEGLHCPIGLPEIAGKEPATIALSVAADLLIRHEALRKTNGQASVLPQQSQFKAVAGI
jgi:xanthine dehydrogenase accessory factor